MNGKDLPPSWVLAFQSAGGLPEAQRWRKDESLFSVFRSWSHFLISTLSVRTHVLQFLKLPCSAKVLVGDPQAFSLG